MGREARGQLVLQVLKTDQSRNPEEREHDEQDDVEMELGEDGVLQHQSWWK